MDVKFNKDGPITFGALGGTYPQMNARAGDFAIVSGIVRNGVLGPAVGDIVRPDNAASITITIGGVEYTADSGILGDPFHLIGPVVNEYHKAVPLTNHLTARFVIRKYVGFDTPRIDLTVENNWAYEPGPQNFVYDFAISVAGKVVYSQAGLTHLVQARWRMLFDGPDVVGDFQWLGTNAVPNYDSAFQPSEQSLDQYAARALNSGPMQIGAASPYFPTTGGNDEIGILPAWQSAYVLSQDPRASDCTLATANGAGSFGVHFRDKDTDRPISLAKYPYMTVVGYPSDTWNPDTNLRENFPAPGGDTTTPYTPDEAHQPSLAYLAYLITGDYFYLEEVQFWAMYNSFRESPNYRDAGKGLIVAGELRAQAWSLRTIAHAAYVTPDADPLKTDLMALVKNNIDWYTAQYVGGPLDNKLGVPTHGYSLAYGDAQHLAVAPWMHDFFTSVFGHLIDLGFTDAKPFFNWLCKFTVGRMMSPDICSFLAIIYALPVCDTPGNGQPIVVYDTFAKAFTALYGEAVMAMPCGGAAMAASQNRSVGDLGGVSNGVMGYPSNYQPALAYAVSMGIPGAQEAWDLFMARTVKPDYRDGSQFSIIPVGYVNPYVPPVDDPTQDWQQIAIEGQTVTVPNETPVRFGAGSNWVNKVVSGSVTANNATFGDPAPGVPKTLQQLISTPPEGNTMTYTVSLVPTTSQVELPAGSEATPTSTIAEILDADKSTVLASSGVAPYSFPGITFGDRFYRLTDYDSKGAVMGTPVIAAFTLPDDTVVVPPIDTTPVTATLTTGATVSWTKD